MLNIFLGNINFIFLFFIWFPNQFGPDRFSRFHVYWIQAHIQTALSLYYLETGVNGLRKCLEKHKMVFKGTVNVFSNDPLFESRFTTVLFKALSDQVWNKFWLFVMEVSLLSWLNRIFTAEKHVGIISKSTISLIKERFQGYTVVNQASCFLWTCRRVTWNYAFSPFNMNLNKWIIQDSGCWENISGLGWYISRRCCRCWCWNIRRIPTHR